MKKLFKQRNFDRKQRGVATSARRLSLETLENRELLNADWGGFSAEILNEFSAESARYSVDLNGSVDYCSLIDMNDDGVDELATINYSSKTLAVYQSDEFGAYSLVKSTQISELDGSGYCAVAFGDVGNDGIADLVVVSQGYSELSLTATVYNGSATFGFAKGASKALDVSKFSDGLLFQTLDATLLKNASGGLDLVVQGSSLSETGTTPRQTVLYSGLGTSTFGQTSQYVNISGSATTADPVLVGSATIDGKETLISIDKTTSSTQRSNRVVLTTIDGANVVNYKFDLASAAGGTGAFVAEWVVADAGTLVVGGTRGGVSGVLSMKITSFANETYQSDWAECDGLTVNAASCAAIGNMGGAQTTPELFVANGRSFVVFNGTASQNAGYAFEQNAVVVTTPNYRAVAVDDFDGNGQKEALLVGDSNIWLANVAADGTTDAARSVYAFDRAVKDAVFGDFDGDGKLDVAVYYQTEGSDVAVGTNLQIFKQESGGAFVPIASYGVASQFVDFTVGRFTQTNADELAVLYQTTSGVQYVSALKLVVSSGSTSLTGARTSRVGAAGATTLTAGSLYGGAVDDLVLVGSNNDSLTVLKNTGSAFSASTLSTNAGLSSVTNYNPTAARIGDVDGDGKADIVVLNSAAGANRGHVAYLLQTATGFTAAKATGYVNGDSPRGLELADFNGDGKLDALTVQTTTDGKSYLYYYLNDGSASIFASGVRSSETTVGASGAFALATIDSNSGLDVALAQGNKFGFYLNDANVAPSGSASVEFLCQSASSPAGANFEAASESARTWLDEWSNFYIDVWAAADQNAAVSTATVSFRYNPAYFTVVGVEAADGFTVSHTVENGVVVATVDAQSGTNATGKTLLARIRFEPISQTISGESYVVGGVAIPEDGVLQSVVSGFSAVSANQRVNGSSVATTDAPTDVALYPVSWDFNNDGTVNVSDFSAFLTYFDSETSAIPANKAQYRIFDANGDGKINVSDFTNFIRYYNAQATKTADSFYRQEPSVSATSAVAESIATLDGEEFALVNPSEAVAANRAAQSRAVDSAFGDWNADDDDDVFDLLTL